MDNSRKEFAEKTLKFLCVGSQIEGIKFYGTQILISESETNRSRIDGQIYLNIESRFKIFESYPEHIPNHEDELPYMDWIDGYKTLCELRLKRITDVKLGESIPHLFVYFHTGEVLFVFGHHNKYECWQLGVWNNSIKDEDWEVIAVPGNNIAIFTPLS
ncbi:hypothetical protein [Paenibacillus sp. V4I5]|uniref:hypothetical protein n=1 Tax=Paenibacillus sp. V4I5 TaxID=3042306 RepID=UPI002791D219|nr:hypothetical protein [Paenibacillus sp. V4I5]MDQ0914613.1 hypothetical protein [Paenibacillus sp. V4I5]